MAAAKREKPSPLALWEKVSAKPTDEGCAKRDVANDGPDTLHQTRSHVPLNRRSAEPNDTFSHNPPSPRLRRTRGGRLSAASPSRPYVPRTKPLPVCLR